MKDVLINDDCLQAMKNIPDKSVDMVLCDLPYGVLNRNNPAAHWDEIIPFEPLWEQYKRVVKDDAAIVLFAQGMFTARLMMSQPKMWRYNLVWDKVDAVGFLNANRQPLRVHEDICVFSKKQTIYHPQMVKTEYHKRNHQRGTKYKSETNSCYGNYHNVPTVFSDEKFPQSIIVYSTANRANKVFHPCAKPIELLRYFIRTYTDMGGGSIGQHDGQWLNMCRSRVGASALHWH